MRRPVLPVLAASAALALVLAGCSGGDSEADGADADTAAQECVASGSASDAVTVDGDLGAEPTIEIDAPVSVEETERTVVIEGDGEEVAQGSTAKVTFTLFNATTGDVATSTGYEDSAVTTITVDEERFLPGLVKTIQCSTVGSRVVGVVPPADAFGEQGYEDFAVAPEDSLVFVVDIEGLVPNRADGEEQPAPEGFPTVTFAENGQPTVEIPEGEEPPAELKIANLRNGDGAEVGDGDTVTVQYQGVNWTSGEVFDESWKSGSPASFPTTGVIEGFGAAMVGQKVGSQVIAIIPPDQGYGPAGGQEGAGIAADDTLVFVIDILDTAPAVAPPAG